MEPSWVGRRVSVRRAHGNGPDGRVHYADVVGDLVGLDAHNAVVDSRSGLVEVALSDVAAARLAPPSTADELALEAVAARGLRPVETGEVGGWVLRADHGFLRRANSVLPLRAPGVPVTEALEQAGRWYAERDLPLRIAVPVEARRLLDADLGERGWPFDTEAHLMARRLPDVTRPEPQVEIASHADDRWLGLYRDAAEVGAGAKALLERHDRVGFASVLDPSGDVLAVARGVVDDDWLGIMAVEVAPRARRQGLATAVTTALWHWGSERGARRSYLQVERANTDAVALYGKLGYWVHHDYHYRQPPTAD